MCPDLEAHKHEANACVLGVRLFIALDRSRVRVVHAAGGGLVSWHRRTAGEPGFASCVCTHVRKLCVSADKPDIDQGEVDMGGHTPHATGPTECPEIPDVEQLGIAARVCAP